jgi:hypothetical protein
MREAYLDPLDQQLTPPAGRVLVPSTAKQSS